jgi:cytochrome P450
VLTWLIYLLSRHPDWLQRIRRELLGVLQGESLGMQHLSQLPLTTGAIHEAMRLFPPFWMIDRTTVSDDRAGGFAIPAGTTVIAFVYGAHRDPGRWRHPDSFAPDRFHGTARELRNRFDYLPFGAGPRGCIGSSYAMLQIALILGVMLARYSFETLDDAPAKAKPMIILRPSNGIRMRFGVLPAESR